MRQKYLDAVERLVNAPEDIFRRWCYCWKHHDGCLFQFLGKNGTDMHKTTNYPNPNVDGFGCATQVKAGFWPAENEEITTMVKNNPLIPLDGKELFALEVCGDKEKIRAVLMEFAKIQDYCDDVFKRN